MEDASEVQEALSRSYGTPDIDEDDLEAGRPHCLCLHGLECPSFEHILDKMFTCTQRNLVVHIPVYIINTSIIEEYTLRNT